MHTTAVICDADMGWREKKIKNKEQGQNREPPAAWSGAAKERVGARVPSYA